MTSVSLPAQPTDAVAPDDRYVPRFDRVERVVHWCNATLFLVLLFTGSTLYFGDLSALVGRRLLIKNIHVYSGLLLPIPLLFGIATRAGRQLRADLRRLNRWDPHDRGWWFRSARKRGRVRLGKFNPGQKLNAAFVGSSIVVMLATGSIMRWFKPFPIDWRTGATFVHDWFFIFLLITIVGHIALGLSDPAALRGIVRGAVPASWARTHRPRWYDEMTAGDEAADAPSTSAPAGVPDS